MKCSSFVVHVFEDVVDVVVHCSASIKALGLSRKRRVSIPVKMYVVGIEATESFIGAGFVACIGRGIRGKFCERWPRSPAQLCIVTIDVEVLLNWRDC